MYLSLSPGETASSMVSRALSTSDEVVVIAGAAPMLPTELMESEMAKKVSARLSNSAS